MNPCVRVVLITAPSSAAAERLARGLVKAKLAACVNVIPGLISHYYWGGKLQKDNELLLIAKTTASRLPKLTAWVRANHPASLPEIIALPVRGGDKRYLAWVARST